MGRVEIVMSPFKLFLCAVVVLAATLFSTADAACNTKVCEKFYTGVYNSLEGVKRKISKDLANGAPAELACKRLSKADSAICELKEPRKLDKNMDLSKMRVKQLRELMQEFGVDCPNCLEKSDMIKRIKETIMSDKKEL